MKLREHIRYWLNSAEHDLETAEKTTIPLTEEVKLFLDEVNDFNLEVRYPEYKKEFYKTCTKEFAEEYFKKKEHYKWIKSLLKSKNS